MTDTECDDLPANAVAIIGAGPAGLVMARWLSHHGFEPVLFEGTDRPGGQWNAGSRLSGTWSGMRTNTSRVMTRFSDLDYPDGTPLYPSREEVRSYLEDYAARFDLTARIRTRTWVEHLQRLGGGWLVRSRCDGGARTERFARVVVASGRYVAPALPPVPGLAGFTGVLGASHSSQYAGGRAYRDRDVLVAGCSISALEIASDIALSGGRSVTVCYRRQRYVLPKLLAGVPTDHVMFTRVAALAGEVLPPDELAAGLKATVLRLAGSPDQFGAMVPDPDIFAAGISQSQDFLPLVAEGRITVRPWIEAVEGQDVRFADGSRGTFDALLFGTGYRLSLPFVAPDLAEVLGLNRGRIDLCDHTFHPMLDGAAFLGLFDQVGPLFPVLELQARWIAYCWAGVIPAPSRKELAAGLARSRSVPGIPMQELALLFARNAQVEPDLDRWPELERALLFGPLSAVSFRLQGPDGLADAPAQTAAAAAAFGAICSPEMSGEERSLRELIMRGAMVRAA
ncbi:flavin-containing monooxygenase [Pelagerythrobacter rhizovicinus]|uniref:Trimethylamine monooxygenase n=1 Tax=Pelagerythrobacter rhizovicinus TaxID=2268576 RepID=A0A4Q2KRP0_9SPHN|nr:FAD-dependent oxidoreductase [Pelagerythrobacter rhizovicinus]RXZ66342.1 dimethylaniline monooxygenase [Pelagerythrobacter rhizovicinus]